MTSSPNPEENLTTTVKELGKNLTTIISEVLEILSLEARLAGKSLLIILALLVVAGLVVITTWLLFMAALVFLLIHVSVSSLTAVLAVIGFNIILLGGIILLIKKLHRNVYFPATRRQLKNPLNIVGNNNE